MGFRITTNMMMNTYRYNLQNSTKRLSDARDKVVTKRKFSSYAEDPAAATLAFRLRRDYLQASSYLANTKDVYSKFNTAWHNLDGVVNELCEPAKQASIRGVNGTAGESRRALAVDLRETAESVVQAMNQKMGDHFIFGGNDALNAPFSWVDGKLLYRGVDVNAAEGTEDYEKLKKMSGEEMYIDLGMGAAETSPNSPIKGTYFNSALCGIDFLGYGTDEDGDPKNLALIMKELADVFDTWSEETQSYDHNRAKDTAEGLSDDELEAKANRLLDKLKAAQEHTTEKWVEMDAGSVYLQSNQFMLETQQMDLNIRILDVEQVDLADAITTFSWEYSCYNAALKIGTQLLSQTLIDYMN